MGIKSIISLIAFVGSFFLSSGLALLWRGKPEKLPAPAATRSCRHRLSSPGFDSRWEKKISRFIQRDIDNGQARQDKVTVSEDFATNSVTSLAKYADAVAEYVEVSGSMDDSALPHDFQEAWQAHMQAWRAHSTFLNNFKEQAKSLAQADSGEFALYAEQSGEISETWFEVKRVADSYGATDFVE